MRLNKLVIFSLLGLFPLLTGDSFANRRHFTYCYESAVLPKGGREIELWNTLRLNRKDFYRGLDNRTEFEFGLGGNLQTSLYLNLSIASEFADGAIQTEQSFGISNEWKYKLLDATADPVGLALYAEGELNTDEIELEGKVLLDKQIGDLLLVFNAIGDHSFVTGVVNGATDTQPENITEFVGGAAYFLTPSFTIGIEARQQTKKPPLLEGGGSYSAFFVGPSISFAGPNWWTAFSVMPQLTGSGSDGSGVSESGKYELQQHEKVEGRLLLAFEF
ncbi:MAG: hypothetical protein Q8916_12390 [Bacteroidota bacterium]|nr:hypothetical protein [Bacteroidota bacterium]MDP4231191.1 hypothetical protein [Bacteroidota bacterium]MDP4235571.1 hypothetical protein [Bacteroidota bacterium]